jgi:WD40 repeat protein
MDPPLIPDHILLWPIGRGAYGEVWLARNIMGTLRAVKIIERRQFHGERPYEREFAGIQHYEPVSRTSGGLVHVLHVGRNDAQGYFYYVMELADGIEPSADIEAGQNQRPAPPSSEPDASQASGASRADHPSSVSRYMPRTLRSDLKHLERLPTAQCLRLALDVVSGLAQLHRHSLVHRDVKPGNIIYVNGRAKLADIGLVSARGEARTFVGTEGYIPPEGPGTPAADLYALGIVLYEASTGNEPDRFPDVPAEWFAERAGDEALEFQEIVLKACEGQRERRYQTADEMQADLALLQSGQSVRHIRALKRRYARLKATGVAGTTLLVVALLAAWAASYRARLEVENRAQEARLRQQAQQSLVRAETAERAAHQQLNTALYEQARALVLSKELGHRARALDALRRAAGASNSSQLRRVAFAALGLPDLRLVREVPLRAGQTLAQVDPEFERVALGHGSDAVEVCSLADLHVLARLPATASRDAYVARWSGDGRFLAVKRQQDFQGSRSDLEVWEVGPRVRLVTVYHDVAWGAFSFHPHHSRLLLLGRSPGTVCVEDLDQAKEQQRFELGDDIRALSFSPDGSRFAASYQKGADWVVAVLDATTGAELSAVTCPYSTEQISWHPHGRWIGICGESVTEWTRAVRLMSPETGALTVLGEHRIKTAMTEFSPDGGYVMSAGWERELMCWDLQTEQRVFTFSGAGYSQTWRNDGRECALTFTAAPEQRLQFYAFEPPEGRQLLVRGGEALRAGAFSPDGRWLAIPGRRALWVWDLGGRGEATHVPLAGESEVFFSCDPSELFVLSGPMEAAQLQAWRIAPASGPGGPPQLAPVVMRVPPRLSGAALGSSELVLTSAEGVRFVPKDHLAQGNGRVVKIQSGKGIVSPDNRWLVVTYPFSRIATVYRLPEVQKIGDLEAGHLIGQVCFTPSGDELTIINRAGIEWWDTRTWQLKERQPGAPVGGAYVLYTPDAAKLWKVTTFHDTGLYDRHTLDPLLPLPANTVPLALSSDGRQVAVSVDDQRVQVWQLKEVRAHLRRLGLDWND